MTAHPRIEYTRDGCRSWTVIDEPEWPMPSVARLATTDMSNAMLTTRVLEFREVRHPDWGRSWLAVHPETHAIFQGDSRIIGPERYHVASWKPWRRYRDRCVQTRRYVLALGAYMLWLQTPEAQ